MAVHICGGFRVLVTVFFVRAVRVAVFVCVVHE